ncbi:unnamed protein product [Blepharisma stoltei]|uniref:Uncharacterized protein n=1 Tax=Blepharisma stoltei TaxID=1481888 RepID=A0AAU9IW15_9CILI|nr:unnamed protein product [Blepharisma stoltei]
MSKRHGSIDSKTHGRSHRTKKSLPPISHRLRDTSDNPSRVSPYDKTSELNLYTYFNDKAFISKEPSIAHKFFNIQKSFEPYSPTSPSPDLVSKSVIIPNDTPSSKVLINSSLKAIGKHSKWEMMERIENYEIKKAQKIASKRDFDSLSEEFYGWFQCYNEIVPLIKLQSAEAAKACSKINDYVITLFSEISNEFKNQKFLFKEQKTKLEKTISELEEKVLKFEGVSEEKIKYSKLEEEKIKREINEIFGEDDGEYQNFRQKANKLYSIKSGATTEALHEIYNDMAKEREIPPLQTYENVLLKPEEIEKSLMKNFKTLQRNTAQRVLKIFESKQVKIENSAQTGEIYIEPIQHEKAISRIEELEKQFQELSQEHSKSTEQLSHMENLAKEINNEKESVTNALYKAKREIEVLMEQIKDIEKDKERIVAEHEARNLELNKKTAESKDLELKIDNQFDRIGRLVQKTEEYEKLLKQSRKKIKELEMKGAQESKGSQLKMLLEKLPSENSKSLLSSQHTSKNNITGESSKSIIIPQPEYEFINENISQIDTEEQAQKNFNNSDSRTTLDFNTRAVSRLSMDTNCSQTTGVSQIISKHQSKNSYLSKVEENQASLKPNSTPVMKKYSKRDMQEYQETAYNEANNNYNRSEEMVELSHAGSISEDDGLKLDPKWGQNVKNSGSQKSVSQYTSNNYMKITNRAKTGENGNPRQMREESCSTLELSIKNSRESSKGIQYNWENPDADYDSDKLYDSNGNLIYLVPFNPNNVYGLKGDNYHHTLAKVFQAQPAIPELKDSIIFKPSYNLEKEAASDNSKKIQKKKNKTMKKKLLSPYLP